MDKATKGYANIYKQEDPDPPGLPMATHVDPFYISDDVPRELEVEVEI